MYLLSIFCIQVIHCISTFASQIIFWCKICISCINENSVDDKFFSPKIKHYTPFAVQFISICTLFKNLKKKPLENRLFCCCWVFFALQSGLALELLGFDWEIRNVLQQKYWHYMYINKKLCATLGERSTAAGPKLLKNVPVDIHQAFLHWIHLNRNWKHTILEIILKYIA